MNEKWLVDLIRGPGHWHLTPPPRATAAFCIVWLWLYFLYEEMHWIICVTSCIETDGRATRKQALRSIFSWHASDGSASKELLNIKSNYTSMSSGQSFKKEKKTVFCSCKIVSLLLVRMTHNTPRMLRSWIFVVWWWPPKRGLYFHLAMVSVKSQNFLSGMWGLGLSKGCGTLSIGRESIYGTCKKAQNWFQWESPPTRLFHMMHQLCNIYAWFR